MPAFTLSYPSRCTLGALSTLAVASSALAGLPTYTVDVLGPNLQGFGMNERGDIVGRKVISGNQGLAFVAKVGGQADAQDR